jgi:DNA-binding CsgD family transcriptional regulator
MTLLKKQTAGSIFLYAAALGCGTFILSLADYRYHIRDLKLEFYLILVALIFGGIGAWIAFSIAGKPARQGLEVPEKKPIVKSHQQLILSERELEVLQAVACGMSNQQIAEYLHVSLSTIKTHNASVFSKLGVQRRTQAVNEAIRLGILKHSIRELD